MLDPGPLLDLLKTEIIGQEEVNQPLYKKLKRGIHKAVDDGLIDVDESLPSERDLASSLGLSRITVRRAVTELAESGLLIQRQGAGTFVNNRVEQPLTRLTGFTEDMTARGMQTDITWLDRSVGIASPHEAQMLNLEIGAKVSRLYRIRSAEGVAMCLEYACLPNDLLPDPGQIGQSLYEYLEQHAGRPVQARQKIRAELFDMEHAHLLGVQPGSACLYIERQSFLADGTPVEFVRSHYRGDSYDFIAELQL
jgi:GntR family transcriptional regulator, N-acetylglucosamine utilization regulator